MAKISTATATKTFRIEKWLGLNEAIDGDTDIKMGEATVMRNFRITREGHLQIRPGYAPICTLAEGETVRGLWQGYADGEAHFLAACGGKVWDIDTVDGTAVSVGEIEDAPTFFFGFGGKVYILTGREYYRWGGKGSVETVEGYVPVVVTAAAPDGGGTLLERVNLLTGQRRGEYSPDGAATVFQLPENGLDEVISVEGTDIAWTADPAAGTVTFDTAPEQGVNTLTVTWRKGSGQRSKVCGMRFAEIYNGDADTRVFLYGDGTNETVYSDLDHEGVATAEYFPEMNVLAADSANTPITALIRHYDRLLVFKPDGVHTAQYSTLTLESGEVTACFMCVPVNRAIGNEAPGQVRLVENCPRSVFGNGVYQWALSSSGSRDERNAKRISDRVGSTLGDFDNGSCITFEDEGRQEYYIVYGSRCLVHNYGSDTWYSYTNFPARCLAAVGGEVYFGTGDGRIMRFSRDYRSDDGAEIDAYWESGSMDFGQDWARKYSANLWIVLKPEYQGRITVTAESNRKSDYAGKTVACSFAVLDRVNFAHWSFHTNRKPQVERVRLKVKKFAFYKLIFSSFSAEATATVMATDFQVRYTGNVK